MSDVKTWKAKAWKVFSIWIRKRDKRCVTCGATMWDGEKGEYSIVGLEAGHYIHNKLDFNEKNINAQCTRCNHFLSGNLGKYAEYLISKYGVKVLEELRKKADAEHRIHFDEAYYKKMYEKYK